MHEHGIGLPKDFFLAKRYFDQTASNDANAMLPVQLALGKLAVHSLLEEHAPWMLQYLIDAFAWLRASWPFNEIPDAYSVSWNAGDTGDVHLRTHRVTESGEVKPKRTSAGNRSVFGHVKAWIVRRVVAVWDLTVGARQFVLDHTRSLTASIADESSLRLLEDVLLIVLALALAVLVYLRSRP